MKVGDEVESTDWREHGAVRKVVDIPGPGNFHHGYCFLEKVNGRGATRVRLRKNGLPERYRLVSAEKQEEFLEDD